MQGTGHSYNKIKSSQCRDGWMEALADKVHKENTIYNIATLISHSRPYISSSKYW